MSDVDKALLIELSGGEAEAKELLALYFESARGLLLRLHDAAARQDRDSVGKAAHQMAGAAGTCGFVRMEEQVRTIETTAEEIPWPELTQRIETVEKLFATAETEARALFPEKENRV